PRTENPEPRTTNPEPRTQNPEPGTQNQQPRTENREPGTKNAERRTPNPEPRRRIQIPARRPRRTDLRARRGARRWQRPHLRSGDRNHRHRAVHGSNRGRPGDRGRGRRRRDAGVRHRQVAAGARCLTRVAVRRDSLRLRSDGRAGLPARRDRAPAERFRVRGAEGREHRAARRLLAVVKVAASRAGQRPCAAAHVRRRRARPEGARSQRRRARGALGPRAARAHRDQRRSIVHARLPVRPRQRAARGRASTAHRCDRSRPRAASRSVPDRQRISRRRDPGLRRRRARDGETGGWMADAMSGLRGVVAVTALLLLNAPAAVAQTPAQEKLLAEIKAADSDQLAVSEADGRFLRVMITASGARNALEIGGAYGYSAIWIGLALRQTGGRLTTIEYDPARA